MSNMILTQIPAQSTREYARGTPPPWIWYGIINCAK